MLCTRLRLCIHVQVGVAKIRILVQTVQVVWCVVAAKGHVPVLMVEVEGSCMLLSCRVDKHRIER